MCKVCRKCGGEVRIASLRYVQIFGCDRCALIFCRPQDHIQATEEIELIGGVDLNRKIPLACLTVEPLRSAA